MVECTLYGILNESKLDQLKAVLIGITGSYPSEYGKHDMVFKPADETPFGPSRNDDAILSLESNIDMQDDEFQSISKRSWKVVHKTHPEPPRLQGPQVANNRTILESQIDGNCLDFMDLLGYKFSFEFCKKGYQFDLRGIKIYVYQVYKFPTMHKLKDVEPVSKSWIVEAMTSCSQDQVAAWSQQLFKLSSQLSPILNLKTVEHTSLQQKIKYQEAQ